MTIETLSEDTIRSLAAQFNTLPEAIKVATGLYLPPEKSPAYYEGYANAVVMIARMLNEMQMPLNTDVLMALAGKAAQLRQSLVDEEADGAWLDELARAH
jgi:hypothetical protein